MLMLAPHVAAVWLAWKARPFWSGVLAGVAFWISPKGFFVAAACALWNPAGIPWMVAGFAAVGGAGALGLWMPRRAGGILAGGLGVGTLLRRQFAGSIAAR